MLHESDFNSDLSACLSVNQCAVSETVACKRLRLRHLRLPLTKPVSELMVSCHAGEKVTLADPPKFFPRRQFSDISPELWQLMSQLFPPLSVIIPFFWHCAAWSPLHCWTSSSSVSEGRTEKLTGERIFQTPRREEVKKRDYKIWPRQVSCQTLLNGRWTHGSHVHRRSLKAKGKKRQNEWKMVNMNLFYRLSKVYATGWIVTWCFLRTEIKLVDIEMLLFIHLVCHFHSGNVTRMHKRQSRNRPDFWGLKVGEYRESLSSKERWSKKEERAVFMAAMLHKSVTGGCAVK